MMCDDLIDRVVSLDCLRVLFVLRLLLSTASMFCLATRSYGLSPCSIVQIRLSALATYLTHPFSLDEVQAVTM
jgi:hypothetical protein